MVRNKRPGFDVCTYMYFFLRYMYIFLHSILRWSNGLWANQYQFPDKQIQFENFKLIILIFKIFSYTRILIKNFTYLKNKFYILKYFVIFWQNSLFLSKIILWHKETNLYSWIFNLNNWLPLIYNNFSLMILRLTRLFTNVLCISCGKID